MISLARDDIRFMLDRLELQPDLRSALDGLSQTGGEISDEDADQLRDLCGERLQTHGFDQNYELTEEGRRLESLIDALFTG
jgi:hypothetical protein